MIIHSSHKAYALTEMDAGPTIRKRQTLADSAFLARQSVPKTLNPQGFGVFLAIAKQMVRVKHSAKQRVNIYPRLLIGSGTVFAILLIK